LVRESALVQKVRAKGKENLERVRIYLAGKKDSRVVWRKKFLLRSAPSLWGGGSKSIKKGKINETKTRAKKRKGGLRLKHGVGFVPKAGRPKKKKKHPPNRGGGKNRKGTHGGRKWGGKALHVVKSSFQKA